MSGISSREQRLAWQHDEQTAGLYRDPCLDEVLETADETARHYDFPQTGAPLPPPAEATSGHPAQRRRGVPTPPSRPAA